MKVRLIRVNGFVYHAVALTVISYVLPSVGFIS
jgi:hypothetical protein